MEYSRGIQTDVINSDERLGSLKLVCPYLNSLIEIKTVRFQSDDRNQQLFRKSRNMHYQQNGKGNIVVSGNNTPVPFKTRRDIRIFRALDLNSKSLISKAVSRLEKTANDAEHYLKPEVMSGYLKLCALDADKEQVRRGG